MVTPQSSNSAGDCSAACPPSSVTKNVTFVDAGCTSAEYNECIEVIRSAMESDLRCGKKTLKGGGPAVGGYGAVNACVVAPAG